MMTEAAFGALELTWIKVRELSVVWVDAQRPFNDQRKRKAESIAATFDPDKFGVIHVAQPNGKGVYHIIDGQTRVCAIGSLYGLDENVPCLICKSATTIERAAEIFLGLNQDNRNNVEAITRFKSSVVANREPQTSINGIVREHDYAVGHRASDADQSRIITAVGALMGAYEQSGPKALGDALKLIRATWGRDSNATSGPIIRAYAAVLKKYPGINWGRLKQRIQSRYTPGNLLAAAKGHREQAGGTIPEAVENCVVAYYNRGLPENKKLQVGH